jgi:hypothetical protein
VCYTLKKHTLGSVPVIYSTDYSPFVIPRYSGGAYVNPAAFCTYHVEVQVVFLLGSQNNRSTHTVVSDMLCEAAFAGVALTHKRTFRLYYCVGLVVSLACTYFLWSTDSMHPRSCLVGTLVLIQVGMRTVPGQH